MTTNLVKFWPTLVSILLSASSNLHFDYKHQDSFFSPKGALYATEWLCLQEKEGVTYQTANTLFLHFIHSLFMNCPVYIKNWAAWWCQRCVLFLKTECHIRISGSACCFCQIPWSYTSLCLTLQTVAGELNENKHAQIFHSFRLFHA